MRGVKKNTNKKKTNLTIKKNSHFYKNPIFLIIISIVLIIVAIIFSTNLFLSIRLLVMDDSLVRLTTNNQEFFLENSEKTTGEFNIYVSTNPFCKSICKYSLLDISTGEILESNNFSTIISNPYSIKYEYIAPRYGKGQKLFRFNVSCLSKKTNLCKTTKIPIKKSILVSLNYNLNSYQKDLRKRSLEKLNKLINENTNQNNLSLENKYLYEILSLKILTPELKETNLSILKNKIKNSLNDFKNYKYELVLNSNINPSNKILQEENTRLKTEIKEFNNFTLLVKEKQDEIINLTKEKNLSKNNEKNITNLIVDYNAFVISLNSSFNVKNKTIEFNEIIIKINKTRSNLNKSNKSNFTFKIINQLQIKPIITQFTSDYKTNLSIQQEELICCYNGICNSCCDDSCSNNPDKYPIILLHGHSFNSAISAEKSLTDLKEIQDKLFSERFLDGGDLILSDKSNSEIFKRTNQQLVFSASYYFDIYKNTEETITLETKSDNLNTYALRLNDIVKNVKLTTNKDKAIIIAHSMGGLVSRRYLQIFGEEDIEKLIMIGTPNHGIDGKILSGCPILGEDKHCEDMDKTSLFINKLTFDSSPKIPVENIIGIGCDMNGENGDGVVKNSSCYIPWANNYYINGNCEGFNFLHGKLLEPDKYPKVYDLIKSFLNN